MYEFTSDLNDVEIPHVDVLSLVLDSPNAGSYADKKIYLDANSPEDRFLTGASLLISVRKVIAGLKAWGVKPGDCVCVQSFGNYLYSVLFLAIVGSGAKFIGINPSYTEQEIRHACRVANVTHVLVQPECSAAILATAQELKHPPEQILLFDGKLDGPLKEPTQQVISWRYLLQHGEQDWARFDDEAKAKNTPAVIYLTSGTTGFPKAAVYSHYGLVATYVTARDQSKAYELKRLITLPMFHAFAAPMVHLAPAIEGCMTYVSPRFDLLSSVACVSKNKITEWPVVPQVIILLMEALKSSLIEPASLASLMMVPCGGAPLPVELQRSFEKLLHPEGRVAIQWGLSEIGTLTKFPFSIRDDTGSVGKLFPNTKIRLCDNDGKYISEDDRPGEIEVHTACRMVGFLRDATPTSALLAADGWYNTGDVGYCRAGKWYLVDRAKDMIKVRGWQVSPAELEATLLRHDGIADAAVIGVVRNGEMGEVPRAYVVLSAGGGATNISPDDVVAFSQKQLAGYKKLEGGVAFIESIPKNPSGKILRRALRELAKQEGFGIRLD